MVFFAREIVFLYVRMCGEAAEKLGGALIQKRKALSRAEPRHSYVFATVSMTKQEAILFWVYPLAVMASTSLRATFALLSVNSGEAIQKISHYVIVSVR